MASSGELLYILKVSADNKKMKIGGNLFEGTNLDDIFDAHTGKLQANSLSCI